MTTAIDTLIHARWIVPVVPENTVLENHSIAIQDHKIVAILPTDAVEAQYQAQHQYHLGQHVLIPGLVNAHTHAAMNLMRGIADDLPLMTWLNDHIWPVEGKFVSREFVEDGTRLAIAEMIKGGTTCFNEMYFFPDAAAKVASDVGMRAAIGLIALDFPTVWAQDSDEYLHKGIEVHDKFRGHPLISTCFAPHAPYTVSDAPLEKIRTYADEMDIPIHMHVHETADEVSQAVEQSGKRPLQRLNDLGLLTPKLLAVHMTQLTDDEIKMVADSGASVIHCPESNMKLASGYCPVGELLQAGVNVALGTDGAASNNDLNMFGEMRSAALMAKNVDKDASSVAAHQALAMATINGARALGLDEHIGSLQVGKAADIVAVDLAQLNTQPVYNPISQLVYAANAQQVSDVWVAGRHLLKGGQLTQMDELEIINNAQQWQERISAG